MSDNSKWRLLLGLGAVPGFCVVMGSYIESKYAPKKTSVNSSEKDPSVSMWDALTDPKNQKKLLLTVFFRKKRIECGLENIFGSYLYSSTKYKRGDRVATFSIKKVGKRPV